jgi:hypothetical protein
LSGKLLEYPLKSTGIVCITYVIVGLAVHVNFTLKSFPLFSSSSVNYEVDMGAINLIQNSMANASSCVGYKGGSNVILLDGAALILLLIT